ncbi:30S ribosomal protein S11 [Hyalella azteca]|uniref:30S ribosomal protein S11 n=1 Tax=Hyalella azteca TaxID=294128 RepID=A0A8B7N0Q9_HYAAZ|nr:30S ribosomal protein S11 [Hyalella azteca]
MLNLLGSRLSSISLCSSLPFGLFRDPNVIPKVLRITQNSPCTLSCLDSRPLWTGSLLYRNNEKRENVKNIYDDGAQGEYSFTVENKEKFDGVFPDENTPNMLFDDVKFSDLHILEIKVSKNNTIMGVFDTKGKLLMNRSCRSEGFRHARKKTAIAAQATGFSLGTLMYQAGIKTVRARIRGLGSGRIAGIKGISLSGVNVVAISDFTDINYTNDPRPKKRRRI